MLATALPVSRLLKGMQKQVEKAKTMLKVLAL
jgi:hypothetical protein